MTLKLCIDDFGLTEGINEAVYRLNDIGLVRHAALSPYGSAYKKTLSEIRNRESLGIGLHFSLTDLRSEYKCSLVRQGRLIDRRSLLLKCLWGDININEVYGLLEDQYNILTNDIGAVYFINGHQDIHELPIIRSIVNGFAREKNIMVRSCRLPIRQLSRIPIKTVAKYGYNLISSMRNENRNSFSDYYFCAIRRNGRIYDQRYLTDILTSMLDSNKTYEIGLHCAANSIGLDDYWKSHQIRYRIKELVFFESFHEYIVSRGLENKVV